MEINVRKAQILPGGLMLMSDDNFAPFVYNFKPGAYEITRARKRRSLDANAYAWVLIDKIAEAVGLSKEKVYQGAIRQIGGVSEIVQIKTAAVSQFCHTWKKNGLGFQTDVFDGAEDGKTNVIVYYGSSTYDTKQMSNLINQLVMTAQDLGIETKDPYEIKSLLDSWRDKNVRNND